jgi:hypothetical protein
MSHGLTLILCFNEARTNQAGFIVVDKIANKPLEYGEKITHLFDSEARTMHVPNALMFQEKGNIILDKCIRVTSKDF